MHTRCHPATTNYVDRFMEYSLTRTRGHSSHWQAWSVVGLKSNCVAHGGRLTTRNESRSTSRTNHNSVSEAACSLKLRRAHAPAPTAPCTPKSQSACACAPPQSPSPRSTCDPAPAACAPRFARSQTDCMPSAYRHAHRHEPVADEWVLWRHLQGARGRAADTGLLLFEAINRRSRILMSIQLKAIQLAPKNKMPRILQESHGRR